MFETHSASIMRTIEEICYEDEGSSLLKSKNATVKMEIVNSSRVLVAIYTAPYSRRRSCSLLLLRGTQISYSVTCSDQVLHY